MKYIVNVLLFFIMIFTLTVMPIDMKALQVDVSWEKYKAIEEKKETEKQKEVISETVKTSQYDIKYSGENYLFNPTEIKLNLSGDEKLGDLQTDVLSKLTFEWENLQSKDVQILTVPQDVLKVGQTLSTTVDVTINLANLTQIQDGHYKLKIRSQSELTASATPVEMNISWLKQSTYTPTDDSAFKKSATAVTFYYPTTDGGRLIPITESVTNEKILRKIANRLYSGPTADLGLRVGQSAPRIRNIKHSSGKLSLYMNTSDVDAAKKAGLTPAQMTEILTKTYFSLPYIKEIKLYVANKPVTAEWTASEAPSPIARPAATSELFQMTSIGKKLLFVSTPKTFTTPQDVLTALSTADQQNGKLMFSPVPTNVTLTATADPKKAKVITVDLIINGKLYGENAQLTQMMLDAIAINLSRSGLVEEVHFTVGGQPAETLNKVNIKEAYPIPKYINIKAAE